MLAIENELEQYLTPRTLMVSLQALWFSICPRDWPALWGEGPEGFFGQPRLGLEKQYPSCPSPPPHPRMAPGFQL